MSNELDLPITKVYSKKDKLVLREMSSFLNGSWIRLIQYERDSETKENKSDYII